MRRGQGECEARIRGSHRPEELHQRFEEVDGAELLLCEGVWYSANSCERAVEFPMGRRMKLPKYALDILVCPVCKTRVELLSDESGLKCGTCGRIYPVRDEIPVMLPEEATIGEYHPKE